MSLNVTSLCVFDDKLVIGSDKGYIYIYSLLNGNMLKKICSRLGEVKDIKVHSNGILCIIDEYVVFWEISVNNLLAKKEKYYIKRKTLLTVKTLILKNGTQQKVGILQQQSVSLKMNQLSLIVLLV